MLISCTGDVSDRSDGDCNLTEPLGSEGEHELDVKSDEVSRGLQSASLDRLDQVLLDRGCA